MKNAALAGPRKPNRMIDAAEVQRTSSGLGGLHFPRRACPRGRRRTILPGRTGVYQANWLTLQIGNRSYGLSKYRIYDPELGIFLSRDPKPALNRYWSYASNPVSNTDSEGLEIETDCPIDELLQNEGIRFVGGQNPENDRKFHYRAVALPTDTLAAIQKLLQATPDAASVAPLSVPGLVSGQSLKQAILQAMVNSYRVHKFDPGNPPSAEGCWINILKHVDARIAIVRRAHNNQVPRGCRENCTIAAVGAMIKPELVEALQGAGDRDAFAMQTLPFVKGIPDWDWIPGDRGFVENRNVPGINNPLLRATAVSGLYNGENIIYLGGLEWWGYLGWDRNFGGISKEKSLGEWENDMSKGLWRSREQLQEVLNKEELAKFQKEYDLILTNAPAQPVLKGKLTSFRWYPIDGLKKAIVPPLGK